jgi:hypothetical protein
MVVATPMAELPAHSGAATTTSAETKSNFPRYINLFLLQLL